MGCNTLILLKSEANRKDETKFFVCLFVINERKKKKKVSELRYV